LGAIEHDPEQTLEQVLRRGDRCRWIRGETVADTTQVFFEDGGIGQDCAFAQFQLRADAVERVSQSPALHGVTTDPFRWVALVAVACKGFIEGLQQARDLVFIDADDGV
jgi:hypothetical protein